jgi:hypothetical protein
MELRDPGTGITRDSLAFYRDHRHQLADLAAVSLQFPAFGDPYDPYLRVLTDNHGNSLQLSGCTTGYVGEGPNGSMQLLVAEGVPGELALAVTDAARLTFVRDNHGWRIDEYSSARHVDDGDVMLSDSRERPPAGRVR